MAEGRHISTGRLVLSLLAFVLLGVPMFAYLWWTLNELLSGYFDPARGAIAAVILIAFLILLSLLARSIQRWEEVRMARAKGEQE